MTAGNSRERLQAAIEQLIDADVAELIGEARGDARNQVRELLCDAFAEAMIDRAEGQLTGQTRPVAEPPRPEGGTRPAGEPPRREIGAEPAWYVYGVIGAPETAAAAELSGVDGGEVLTVADGGLAAVVSHVAREEFDEAQLRTHLSDMTWVEAVARAHEHVLDQLCGRTTVIPMRMCTVYRSEESVRELLQRESASFQNTLELLEGKREWGVQALFSPQRARQSAASEESAASGAAYLQLRRDERELDEQLARVVDEATEEMHASLSAIAFQSLLNTPRRPESGGRSDEMVLNGVYLVEDERVPEFEQEVGDLQARFARSGLELVITGPWPPYNFLPGSIGAAW